MPFPSPTAVQPGPEIPDRADARDCGETPETPDYAGPARAAAAEAPLRAAAARGDTAAFATLYLTYRQHVLGYLTRRCRGDRHLAEDLTQDTFTRAFTALPGYRETGRPFGAWLVTIASNLFVDYWRSAWRRYQIPWHDFTQESAELRPTADLATDPVSRVMERDQQRRICRALSRALSRLPDRQRQVVTLRYAGGMSVIETAAALGVDEGAVKAASYRARQALAGDPEVGELR